MKRRRSLDETRDLLLDTAATMVADGRIDVTIGRLDLTEVSRRAGLSSSGSAYKIWNSQDDFRLDVLRRVLDGTTPDRDAIDAITTLVDGNPDDLPPLPELIRVAAGTSIQGWAAGRSTYTVYLALWLAAAHDDQLATQLHDADVAILDALADMYAAAADAYGLEFVPPYTPAMLATTLSAFVEGLAVREFAAPGAPAMSNLMRPTGPDGTEVPWSLYACGVEAIVAAFTRPRHGPPDRTDSPATGADGSEGARSR